ASPRAGTRAPRRMPRNTGAARASAAPRAPGRRRWLRNPATARPRCAGRRRTAAPDPRLRAQTGHGRLPRAPRTSPHLRAVPGTGPRRARRQDRPRAVRAASHRPPPTPGPRHRARAHARPPTAGPGRRCRRGCSRRDPAAPRRRRTAPRAAGSCGEAAAAAAGRLRVRVADGELRALQALDIIDRRAHQVLQAQRVDQQGHAIGRHREVVIALLFVELEAVLEARAAATLDVDAQLEGVVALFGDQLADLGRGRGGQLQRAVKRLVPGGGKIDGGAHAIKHGGWGRGLQASGAERGVAAVASAQVKDSSTAWPRGGARRTLTRSGLNPSGIIRSPSTCWKYLNEYSTPGASSAWRRAVQSRRSRLSTSEG